VFTALVGLTWIAVGPGYSENAEQEYPTDPPKVLSSDLYPCSECHADLPVNTEKRELEAHTAMVITGHGEPLKWCMDCHNSENRDTLRLIGGEEVEFRELHVLCGQCHGRLYAHWRAGIHGKRTGFWDGEKKYTLCTDCHDPHDPGFKPLAPEPVPKKPQETLK
jgi:uncharacterized CHY-type Zn-finger protein